MNECYCCKKRFDSRPFDYMRKAFCCNKCMEWYKNIKQEERNTRKRAKELAAKFNFKLREDPQHDIMVLGRY